MNRKTIAMKLRHLALLLPLVTACGPKGGKEPSDHYTLGIGNYPGAPEDNFAPRLVADQDYRNIALNRSAYASGSYDSNLTAQLVTDGIVSGEMPDFVKVTSVDGIINNREREYTFDQNEHSSYNMMGSETFIQYEWVKTVTGVKAFNIDAALACDTSIPADAYKVEFLVSDNGEDWRAAALVEGKGLPGVITGQEVPSDPNKQEGFERYLPLVLFRKHIPLENTDSFRFLRINFSMACAKYWQISDLNPVSAEGREVQLIPSNSFGSAWLNGEGKEQWVYVDLGVKARFDNVKLKWVLKPDSAKVETSDDAKTWKQIATVNNDAGLTDDLKVKGNARYVRVSLPDNLPACSSALSEVEVYGRGGLHSEPKAVKGLSDGKFYLHGGNWKLARATSVDAAGEVVASEDFDASSWLVATVPGTVLVSYINNGAVPNPNFADNIANISDSYFNEDFWYRDEFELPSGFGGKHIFLNLDGINWTAQLWLNGVKLGDQKGAFIRGRFDITSTLMEGKNVLAVKVVRNAHYGSSKEKNMTSTDKNGGILGADNPTFHASIGWDWITSVRGRNMGIWNNVFISASGDVTVKNPLVLTKLNLPDTAASITAKAVLVNHSSEAVSGTLEGFIGNVKFSQEVALAAKETREVAFTPEAFAQLKETNMQLWWPNGYGEPYLHDAGFTFTENGQVSDRISYKAGLRQMDYSEVDIRLQMFVNGKRFIPLGGNWGFSEHNLLYRAREYDIAVKYHAEMNFNLIRNWVGQIGDEPFYEACDRHGVMVWQDFWLANPWDGPDPYDNELFMSNATDYIGRIRNHASIGLYCGRNEGFPPAELDRALRVEVAALHPGIEYIPSSADAGVGGYGPYNLLPVEEYFGIVPQKLHSERGMPDVMNIESLRRTFSEEVMWPVNIQWAKHDFTQQGAQRGASFTRIMANGFGEPRSVEEFAKFGQIIDYIGYRAMYESSQVARQGLVIWMSHPCWPSMVWQSYDYYFDPTGAYFGAMKACEPVHVQWNAAKDCIEVVNMNRGDLAGASVSLVIRDVDGKVVSENSQTVDIKNDSTVPVMEVGFPESGDLILLCLSLKDASGIELSSNFYLKGREAGNYRALRNLGNAKVQSSFTSIRNGNQWSGKLSLKNTSDVPAMFLRANLLGSDGEQILPVLYEDNFFSLLPGEDREISILWSDRDARGLEAHIELTGFNCAK